MGPQTLRFKREKQEVLVSEAEREVCFGCGQAATGTRTLYFEDDGGGLVSNVQAVSGRHSMTLPLCAGCRALQRGLVLRTIGWSLAVPVALVMGFVITDQLGLNGDERPLMFMAVILGIAFWPMGKAKEAWQRKDRGGSVVELVRAKDRKAELAFQDI